MRTIYKYEIPVGERDVQVQMLRGAKILSIGQQGDPHTIVVWAEVENDEPAMVSRFFQIYGTGHPFDPLTTIDGEFIGTVNNHPIPLVWHVYEVKP